MRARRAVKSERLRTPSPLLVQHDGTVGGPAEVDLIAPIDGPLGRAAVVLGENRDHLAGFGLDAIGGAIAEISELPNSALDLIDGLADPAAGDRLLAQPDLLGTQRNPNPLAAAEPPDL